MTALRPWLIPPPAGTIASFAVFAILLALLVLLRPSLLVRHLLAPLLPGVIFCGDRQRRELALTIDDGPSPGSDGSSHTGSMALLAFPPGLRSGRCPAPKRSGAVPAAAALVPSRRWLVPALDAPQRRREGLSTGAGFDLPVGHLPPAAGLDGLVRAPQRPSRRDSGVTRSVRYPASNHGAAALGGARPAATWLSLREPGSPAQRLSAHHLR